MTRQSQIAGDAHDDTIEDEIIRVASESYERLPTLEVIFDRFALSLATALKKYTSAMTEVDLVSVDYMPCGAALESLASPSLLAITGATPWDGQLALAVDPELLFTTLEIMLGGRSAPVKQWTPRSFTAIEKRLGQRLCEAVLKDLSEAFAPFDKVEFAVANLESIPANAVLAPALSACVRIVMNVRFEGRGGALSFVIPNATIEKTRPLLARSFLGGQIGGDSSWRNQLTKSIRGTDVAVIAVLHELKANLRDVLDWAPGQVLDLGIDMTHEVTVSCSGKKMFRAAMGRRKNGSVALRVTEELSKMEEGRKNGILD